MCPTKAQCSTGQCDGVFFGDARCSIMITDDMIWKVLVRLPTKSLMRFKCVSKLWCSIIRTPRFAIAHGSNSDGGGCFRGLLITGDFYNTSGQTKKLFYVNFNDSPRLMHRQMKFEELIRTHITPVVKGLIGLYNEWINDFTLCNIATQELLNLPPSPSSPTSSADTIDMYNYYLACDPVKQVYKVLNVCSCYNYDEEDNLKGYITSHVFTLGVNNSQMKWTEITPPSLDLYQQVAQCLCINGALYWLTYEGKCHQTLTTFHLNETFEYIAIPGFTQGGFDLVEICGSPALIEIVLTSDYVEMVDVWTMNNHCVGGESEAWTRKRVSLPTSLSQDGMLNYAGTLPSGEMMMFENCESINFLVPIYIYDHLKNEFNSMTIEGCGSQGNRLSPLGWKIYYYEENIITLDCLMNNNQQDQTINCT